MNNNQKLKIARTAGFFMLAVLLIIYWPWTQSYDKINSNLIGCYISKDKTLLVVGSDEISVKSNDHRITLSAEEGLDKLGRHIVTNPGVEFLDSGSEVKLLITDGAVSFRIDDQTLFAYSRDGQIIRFVRRNC